MLLFESVFGLGFKIPPKQRIGPLASLTRGACWRSGVFRLAFEFGTPLAGGCLRRSLLACGFPPLTLLVI